LLEAPRGQLLAFAADQTFHLGRLTLTGALNWTRLREGSDFGANRRSNLQLGVTAAWPLAPERPAD
jgi:hypothetical protein